MISNADIQKAIIAKLKATAAVTTLLGGDTEVREQQWQGRTFTYPNIRVAIGQQSDMTEMEQCEWSAVSFIVWCMSEDRSSFEADNIASAVNSALHEAAWDVTADGFRFHKIRSAGLFSATRMTERIWRAEAAFIARLHTI